MVDKQARQRKAHATPAIAMSDALAIIGATVTAVAATERVPLRQALARVLAEDALARIDVPPCTNSAMDGYAITSSDLHGARPVVLSVVGTAAAGHPFTGTIRAGQCVRIMTGAPLPAGADTVVLQENVERAEDVVKILEIPAPGVNVRAAGEDVSEGAVAVHQGEFLGPAQLGLLASIGLADLKVLRKPRVAFFSTGDELREVGARLATGEIYDSNRYALHGLLSRLEVDIVDLGVVRDDPQTLEASLTAAAACADLIVTTGGVSVGDADHLKAVLGRLGKILFAAVRMKPGRPSAFGLIGTTPWFGLPGNPVSVMATFYQLVRPAIHQLRGLRPEQPVTVSAVCQSRINTRSGRQEFQRGVLRRTHDGYLVETTGPQGSGILSSMTRANCFIVIPDAQDDVAPGTIVQAMPFDALV